ncbi:serine hydrolase [Nocardia wallacei]|uniref:serine hydrolase n=1 Tax=Nocardia wallacei TaxID=480035 RepID=UPI0024550C5A|nr:serine hydrolase [Nocardia wallacei]
MARTGFTVIRVPSGGITQYGLGLSRTGGWLEHSGGVPGYTTQIAYLPERNVSIAVAVTSSHSLRAAMRMAMSG